MIYNACKSLIQRGQIAGLADKLDVFLLADRLSTEQYNELVQMLPEE